MGGIATMIVVFGSLNVDMLVTVDHLPRPGETVLTPDYVLVPGGKGANQACAAARAAGGGGEVTMIGQVGQDDWGPIATHLLIEAGVDTSHIGRAARPTACALIWVDKAGENAIVVASGANLEARAEQVPDALLGPDTWLVVQMEVPVEQNWPLIERAHARGARIILNVAPAQAVPAAVLGKIHILVVNEIEAAMVAEAEGLAAEGLGPAGLASADDPRGAARALAARHGLTCIVTLGRDGAAAFAPDGAWSVGALPITPIDTTGAGDGFVGTLAAALNAGAPLPDALRRASVGAALACLTVGCQSAFAGADAIAARLGDLPPAAPIGT